jgi:hypothetical protein
MEQSDRSMVLYAAAYGPVFGLKVAIHYLRMKRAARRAERSFYRQLVRSGLPRQDAKGLADEYGSAVSVRQLFDRRLFAMLSSWQDRR